MICLLYTSEDDDETETYKIVTTVRGNSLKNLISKESPLGAAIFGHKVGDRLSLIHIYEAISIDEMHVASMNVGACKGCFACWQKTPGVCCINDDMQTVCLLYTSRCV